jgi:hypothetical protein
VLIVVVGMPQDLPEARKQVALENIWRRIYIQDE